ncbi:MAG TPA: hypothetical protein VGX50_14400, partial [Longimicrobium sp.]|nr:hypothetical protein [Longimicrobium sp.]
MKIDRGLLGTLAVAALTAACASAGTGGTGGGGGGGGPRVTIPLPDITCSTGSLTTNPAADSAAGILALISTASGEAQAEQYRRARQQAGRAIAGSPGSSYGYYLAGQAAIGVQDYADADSLFRRAEELCPEIGPYDVDRLQRGSGG